MEKKPCPFCGSENLQVKFTKTRGHGDSSHDDLRVVCMDCPATQGAGNWGDPTELAVEVAWEAWNKRVI